MYILLASTITNLLSQESRKHQNLQTISWTKATMASMISGINSYTTTKIISTIHWMKAKARNQTSVGLRYNQNYPMLRNPTFRDWVRCKMRYIEGRHLLTARRTNMSLFIEDHQLPKGSLFCKRSRLSSWTSFWTISISADLLESIGC